MELLKYGRRFGIKLLIPEHRWEPLDVVTSYDGHETQCVRQMPPLKGLNGYALLIGTAVFWSLSGIAFIITGYKSSKKTRQWIENEMKARSDLIATNAVEQYHKILSETPVEDLNTDKLKELLEKQKQKLHDGQAAV